MTDPTQTSTAQATAIPVAGGTTPASGGTTAVSPSTDGIVVDKNKTPEQYNKEAEQKYIIPRLVREKFPDLIKLIYETESMNQEEREYWMQIMPIMTEEQIKKFRDILINEKEQLSKLDKEYEQEMSRINSKKVPEIDEAKLKQKLQEIKDKEKADEQTDKAKEEELLKQLGNTDN